MLKCIRNKGWMLLTPQSVLVFSNYSCTVSELQWYWMSHSRLVFHSSRPNMKRQNRKHGNTKTTKNAKPLYKTKQHIKEWCYSIGQWWQNPRGTCSHCILTVLRLELNPYIRATDNMKISNFLHDLCQCDFALPIFMWREEIVKPSRMSDKRQFHGQWWKWHIMEQVSEQKKC